MTTTAPDSFEGWIKDSKALCESISASFKQARHSPDVRQLSAWISEEEHRYKDAIKQLNDQLDSTIDCMARTFNARFKALEEEHEQVKDDLRDLYRDTLDEMVDPPIDVDYLRHRLDVINRVAQEVSP